MGISPTVRTVLQREGAQLPRHYPMAPNGGKQLVAQRERVVRRAILTGKLTPFPRQVLHRAVAFMKDEVMLREAQFARESKVHRVDAKDAFEKKWRKTGAHKSYEQLSREDREFIVRTKRMIQQIESALRK